jgi:hypothetical protein
MILICAAVSVAAVVAYGSSPQLAWYAHGIQIITLSRRLEWPLVALSLVFCCVLLAITISGRRGVWWLVGLGPVLALFIRAFSAAYHPSIVVLQSPPLVPADQAISQDHSIARELVVALDFNGKPYAFPYPSLAQAPLILLSSFDRRALVIWSITANRAVVLPMDKDVEAREIEVVSAPADSLLLFDSRLGQFIVGVTGRTVKGERPAGFGDPVPAEKLPLADWTRRHPETLVMMPPTGNASLAPMVPVLPALQFPTAPGGPGGDTRIALLSTPEPCAVLSDLPIDQPLDLDAGGASILLTRDPPSGMLRAYDRHLKEDLFLTFKPLAHPLRKHPDWAMVDAESQSHWTLDGKAVDGPLKGDRLHEIAVDDGLYWGVMKFWMPKLEIVESK